MLKTAEDKKVKVRKTIATLRSKFKKLRVKNKELPGHLGLSAKVRGYINLFHIWVNWIMWGIGDKGLMN